VRGHVRGVTYGHIEALRGLAVEGQSGRTLVLPQGLVAHKEFDWLTIAAHKEAAAQSGYSRAVEVPGEARIPELGLALHFKIVNTHETGKGYNVVEGPNVDLSRLEGKLRVRNWRAGDSFQPAGSRRVRKVKELLQERRVPLRQRRFWPVLECGNSIIWVRGFPPDDRVRVSLATENMVAIVEEPLELAGPEAERQL
jgi:tRNA(Ile)-lysidine synthase